MNQLFKIIKDKLSIMDNMYDCIRIIDPINKKVINTNNIEENKVVGKCYENFNQDTFCNNCISMRAYIEKDTFIKVENNLNKVMLVISSPVTINEKVYVVEIIKDISGYNSYESNINIEPNNNFGDFIKTLNEKIIRDSLTGIYNNSYIKERLPVDINNSFKNTHLFSVIIIDLENYSNIKDKYGADISEKIIKDFTKSVSEVLTNNSYWVGKYRDDKFIVVLNNSNKDDLLKISNYLNIAAKGFVFEYDDKIIKLAVNFKIFSNNNKIINIKDILKELKNDIYDKKEIGVEKLNKEIKLSTLDYKIKELRGILNEMCLTSIEEIEYRKTLKISQDLDKLIVEYMKSMKA